MLVSGIYVEVYTRCRLVDSFDSFFTLRQATTQQWENAKTS